MYLEDSKAGIDYRSRFVLMVSLMNLSYCCIGLVMLLSMLRSLIKVLISSTVL
jgi:hypothetical protein